MLLSGGGEFAIGYEIVELVVPEHMVLRSDPPEMGMHEPSVLRVQSTTMVPGHA